MEDLFVDFTVPVLSLYKTVQKIKAVEVEKYGLKSVHVLCIYYLDKNSSGMTAKELTEATLEDKAAISRALKILQEKGYVSYLNNSRNSVVLLTEEGRKLSDEIGERIKLAVAAVSMDFTEQERSFFYKSLDEIAVNLKNYYKELTTKHD